MQTPTSSTAGDVFVGTQDETVRQIRGSPFANRLGVQPSTPGGRTSPALLFQGFHSHATALCAAGNLLVVGGSTGVVGLLSVEACSPAASLQALAARHDGAVTHVLVRNHAVTPGKPEPLELISLAENGAIWVWQGFPSLADTAAGMKSDKVTLHIQSLSSSDSNYRILFQQRPLQMLLIRTTTFEQSTPL